MFRARPCSTVVGGIEGGSVRLLRLTTVEGNFRRLSRFLICRRKRSLLKWTGGGGTPCGLFLHPLCSSGISVAPLLLPIGLCTVLYCTIARSTARCSYPIPPPLSFIFPSLDVFAREAFFSSLPLSPFLFLSHILELPFVCQPGWRRRRKRRRRRVSSYFRPRPFPSSFLSPLCCGKAREKRGRRKKVFAVNTHSPGR